MTYVGVSTGPSLHDVKFLEKSVYEFLIYLIKS
jgi:hypothetical protein